MRIKEAKSVKFNFQAVVNKIYNMSKLFAYQKIYEFYKNDFALLVLNAVGLVIFAVAGLILLDAKGSLPEPMILHFYESRGEYLLGSFADLTNIYLAGILFFAVNIFFAVFSYYRERILSYVFSFVNIVIAVLLLIYIVQVVR